MTYAAAAVAILGVMVMSAAYAQDITLRAEQSEYYFKVREPVLFSVSVNNTYAMPVQATLTSLLEHNDENSGINQSNSNSNIFTVNPGLSQIDVNLGTHEMPTMLNVDLLLSYVVDTAKIVDLDPIPVYIVDEGAPDQNEQEPSEAFSQDAHIPPQQQRPQPFSDAQDRLQNNQLAQDSSALREEIREQLQQDDQRRAELTEDILQSDEFAEQNEALESMGYSMTSSAVNPRDDSSGTFEFGYQDAEGNQASVTGEVIDGEITEINTQTQQELDDALELLRADPRFQELVEQLGSEYVEMSADAIKQVDGSIEATVSYAAMLNATAHEAQITASIINGTVQDVRLLGDSEGNNDAPWYAYAALAAAIATAAAIAYLYVRRHSTVHVQSDKPIAKPRDYMRESEDLLDEAIRAFAAKRYKLAYSLVGRAMRLRIAYSTGLDREASNTELLEHIRGMDYVLDELRECLGLSSLVVFARREPDSATFERIIATARKIISQGATLSS